MSKSEIGKVALAAFLASAEPGGLVMAAGGAKFDAETWRAARGAPATQNPRQALLTHIDDVIRPGMPEADVLTILGPPDDRDGEQLTWEAGIGLIDYYAFVVVLDASGQVESTRVRQR